ncbi:MAG: family 10 glycosylhydrolase [Planctomycetaceae bacterium]|nr:family 10 glycosylhydrolase [Planctomycetaceae bacterium]
MIRFLPIFFLLCSILSTVSAEEWNATVHLPFATDTRAERASFDLAQNFDLSATDEVHVTFSIDHPEAVGGATLYFHSDNGWYVMTNAIEKPGRQTLVFSLADRRTEERPGRLDTIDQLRLSFWRGKNVNATVELHGYALASYPMVLLEPENTQWDTNAEAIGRQLRSLLTSSGIEVGSLAQTTLTAALLKERHTVILPLNPGLTENNITLLKEFIEGGGKLMAFYQLPPELMRTLGFEPGQYVRPPEGAGTFAEVRFEPWFIEEYGEGTPTAFQQRSWNITSATPGDRFNARTAAVWFDAAGQPTEHAALLVSDRGAFFSHVLIEGDTDRKQALMLSLLAKGYPELWDGIKSKRLDHLYAVGEMPLETEAEEAARKARIAQKIKPIEEALHDRQFNAAYPSLRQGLAEEYIRSLPSVPGERRLWWEHAGTGAYPGDWERTMRELKENGFNAVIPNMLWGGLAHYDSKLLPRSRTFERYGDQIEQAVQAGKRHGVEVHVWKVNFNASNAPQEFVNTMRQAGRTQVKFDGEQVNWLCPSHPENRKLECDSMVEVVRNYDVDGIHFDYIRYPDSNHCYCNGCRERFEEHVGEAMGDWPRATRSNQWREQFDAWRCDQITALVADVHREAKAVKPSIKISAAVFPRQPESKGWVLQDWPLWVERGYLDFLCPMDYTMSAVVFDGYVENQMRIVAGKIPIYPGICAAALDLGIALTTDQIATQIMVARKHGAPGFTIFNLDRNTIQSIPPALRLGPTKP